MPLQRSSAIQGVITFNFDKDMRILKDTDPIQACDIARQARVAVLNFPLHLQEPIESAPAYFQASFKGSPWNGCH